MIKRLFPLPLALLLAAPTLAFGSGGFEDPSQIDRHLLEAMPAATADQLWGQVRQPVMLEDLARDLQISSSVLAELNDVEAQHRFDRGDWVVLPSKQSRVAKQLAVLDASSLRRTPPPLLLPPPVQTTGVVRLGETLLQVAQRYGTTMQELVRLNPGLKTAGLVAGTEVQLVQSAQPRQRAVLGTSGGLSWPELPGFGDTPNSNASTASPKRQMAADISVLAQSYPRLPRSSDFYLKELQRIITEWEIYSLTKESIDGMNRLVMKKYDNSISLYRKGDKVGACRDIYLAYHLNREVGLREAALYAGHRGYYASQVNRLSFELSSTRKEFGGVMQTLLRDYFCR